MKLGANIYHSGNQPTPEMPPLLTLSNELLLLVAEEIGDARHLYHFLRVNRRLAELLSQTLHRAAARSEYSVIALTCATVTRNETMLRVLLENGARMTVKADPMTVIHEGPAKCEEGALRQVLERGANIIIQKRGTKYCKTKERSALQWVAKIGHAGMARVLLENGADISAKDKAGWTALHQAADSGHERVVRILLGKGAQTSVRSSDIYSVSPLDLAIQSGSRETARLILQKSDVTVPYVGTDMMPLHAAANLLGDDVTLVKLLLSKGADIESEDSCGISALGYAARQGNEKVLRLLLDEGATVNDAAYSVLYQPDRWYVQHPWLLAVAKMVLENTPVDFRGSPRKTPLRLAVEYHDEDLVRSILERGADVNARHTDRSTPLHMAAWRGRDDLVKLLLEYGADIHAKDRICETALHAAMRENKFEFHGEMSPYYRGSAEVTRLLIDAGINIDARSSGSKMTALHRAADSPFADAEAVALLLERGANTALRTEARCTALDLALRCGNELVIALLREYEPCSYRPDSSRTPSTATRPKRSRNMCQT